LNIFESEANMPEKAKVNQLSNRAVSQSSGINPSISSRLEMLAILEFMDEYTAETSSTFESSLQNPFLNMTTHLIRQHLEAKLITATSLVAASGVPYATAKRRLQEMIDAGLVEQRPRTRTGKSFSLHPSVKMFENWTQFCQRLRQIASLTFDSNQGVRKARDYYYGGSYLSSARTIQPLPVMSEPLKLPGGLRVMVHGDPTFMAMDSLKRQFVQVIGCDIHQRAFSIDRLRKEALENALRPTSKYDIIAVDLPWIGEFAEKKVLMPLDQVLDIESLDPDDFHAAGWQAAHYDQRLYGVPSQTTPELLFYRRDLFKEAGLNPPRTTDELLHAAQKLHRPDQGRYGIAWNAARGTALGHTFIMACSDFGQPVLNLNKINGHFDAFNLKGQNFRPMINTPTGLQAAEYLLELMRFSPPDILSMSWFERIQPYAAGKVAMAYGYTILAPYFELDTNSPAFQKTDYLPHPSGHNGAPIAPVGGFVLGIPNNLPEKRQAMAAKALTAFTSPEAQKLYVLNGSRTAPRYSVGSDPEINSLSPIFQAVDTMSWRDELQYWPRPPVLQITEIIKVCGEVFHDMLRGIITPKQAVIEAQDRADRVMSGLG
jgi:multiple sugar transport system substrate-binding protein